jgi:hypothetical protein
LWQKIIDREKKKTSMEKSKLRAHRMRRATTILLRNTTWKCGRVESLVVDYLQRQVRRCGHAQTYVKDMLEHFKLKGKQQNEFFEALERLERRRIIKIVTHTLSRQGGF